MRKLCEDCVIVVFGLCFLFLIFLILCICWLEEKVRNILKSLGETIKGLVGHEIQYITLSQTQEMQLLGPFGSYTEDEIVPSPLSAGEIAELNSLAGLFEEALHRSEHLYYELNQLAEAFNEIAEGLENLAWEQLQELRDSTTHCQLLKIAASYIVFIKYNNPRRPASEDVKLGHYLLCYHRRHCSYPNIEPIPEIFDNLAWAQHNQKLARLDVQSISYKL